MKILKVLNYFMFLYLVPFTMAPYLILSCREEANAQFKRDWLVEEEIITLLRARMQDCYFYEKGTGP